MILNIIGGTLLATYGFSTLLTALNLSSSNSRIRRKGNIIKPITTNSVPENIKYFFKDYGYLFLPIYNVIKSFKKIIMKDADFDSDRTAILKDRDRLVEIKKENSTTQSSKKNENEAVEEQKDVQTQRTLPARIKTRNSDNSLNEMDCFEKREYYRDAYNKLFALHKRAKNSGKSVNELNAITSKIKIVVEEYRKCERECTLQELKNERHNLLSNSNTRKMTK